MSHRFGPDVRLRSRSEFDVVQRQGRRVATPLLVMLARPNQLDRDRLGIIASRKLGTAVVRVRAKRRLREIFRTRGRGTIAPAAGALDLVVIPRREMIRAPYASVRSTFAAALERLRRDGARS
ncbi:MAG TPA: ribonuclease P protein component [Vicinamibacterales bacterium]|nr:ribonuclease P protein component [Vicinamibacterales bacterium]